jgi:hypothetical protein
LLEGQEIQPDAVEYAARIDSEVRELDADYSSEDCSSWRAESVGGPKETTMLGLVRKITLPPGQWLVLAGVQVQLPEGTPADSAVFIAPLAGSLPDPGTVNVGTDRIARLQIGVPTLLEGAWAILAPSGVDVELVVR